MKVAVKVVLFCCLFIVLFVVLSFSKSFIPGQYERFAHGIIGLLAALLSTYIFLRIDKNSFADINLKWEKKTLARFFTGFFVGLAITIIMFSCLVLFGNLRLELNQSYNIGSFLLTTLALIPLALMEEIAFRAYPLVTLNRKTSTWASLLITAFLFAVYHVANGWSIPVSFLGPGVWGLIYGLAALYSKGISMPTGMHYAANLTQAAFGMSKGFAPIWTLQQQEGLTSLPNSQLVGVIVQVTLLLLAIVGIEWYVRRKATAYGNLEK